MQEQEQKTLKHFKEEQHFEKRECCFKGTVGQESAAVVLWSDTVMSSAELLMRFASDILTDATHEIFARLQKMIGVYEEELRHQRKLLEIACSSAPVVRLHRLPEQEGPVPATGESPSSKPARSFRILPHVALFKTYRLTLWLLVHIRRELFSVAC